MLSDIRKIPFQLMIWLYLFTLSISASGEDESCRYQVVTWYSEGMLLEKNPNGLGFLDELLSELSDLQSCQFSLSYLPLQRLFPLVARGEVDASLSITLKGLSPNETIDAMKLRLNLESDLSSKLNHYTQRLFSIRAGLFSISNSKKDLSVVPDMSDHKIGSVRYVIFNPDSWGILTGLRFSPIPFSNHDAGLKALTAGRIDLFYSDFTSFDKVTKEHRLNNLKLVKELKPLNYRLVLHRDISESNARELEEAITYLRESGLLERIIERHSNVSNFLL